MFLVRPSQVSGFVGGISAVASAWAVVSGCSRTPPANQLAEGAAIRFSRRFTTKSILSTRQPPLNTYHHFITHRRCYSSADNEITVKVPSMGDSISDGTLAKWHKSAGEQVATDDLVASIETDKVTQEIRSPESGVVSATLAEPNDKVNVGQDLFKIKVGAKPDSSAKQTKDTAKETAKDAAKDAAEDTDTAKDGAQTKETAKATPKDRKDPEKESKKAAPEATPDAPKSTPPPQTSQTAQSKDKDKPQQAAAAPTPSGASRTEKRVEMSRLRQRVATRLKDSQNTYALLTTFQEADLFNLLALREEYKAEFQQKHGVKLGFMSAFVKASAAALYEIPVVNAVIEGDSILYRDYVDISVAVATPKGLVVPVLRNCETLSFADIEKQIVEFGDKAKNGKLTLEDMTGGTFTISNGGVYGSLMGTPIVNPPQSAILGMHAINQRPVVVKDQIVIRPMMYLALTYDHRLIDGREAVTFLRRIKSIIEDPRRLLLGL